SPAGPSLLRCARLQSTRSAPRNCRARNSRPSLVNQILDLETPKRDAAAGLEQTGNRAPRHFSIEARTGGDELGDWLVASRSDDDLLALLHSVQQGPQSVLCLERTDLLHVPCSIARQQPSL